MLRFAIPTFSYSDTVSYFSKTAKLDSDTFIFINFPILYSRAKKITGKQTKFFTYTAKDIHNSPEFNIQKRGGIARGNP